MIARTPRQPLWLAPAVLLAASGFASLEAMAAPERIVYQGVLRGSDDAPLTGSQNMIFRFFDAASGGNEILVDAHLAAGGQAVAVAGGLFTVEIGGGSVTDGGGPGTYASLSPVFRSYADVWLEIQIGAETLSPRLRVMSAPWALQAGDAGSLGGRQAGGFLDTSSTSQVKTGGLVLGAAASETGGTVGVEAFGTSGGGWFRDLNGSAAANIATGDHGVVASGNQYGGWFVNYITGDSAKLGGWNRGIEAEGSTYGGTFETVDPAGGLAYVATPEYGIIAHGPWGGGAFHNRNGTSEAYLARFSEGIFAVGSMRGGYFADSDNTSLAYIAEGDFGVVGQGALAGGSFSDMNGTGHASVGIGDLGVEARGSTAGGYFEDDGGTSNAYLGYGTRGIEAEGSTTGGYFTTSNSSGEAYVGDAGYGIRGLGTVMGGSFDDSNGTGLAYAAYGDYGIQGFGAFAGGYFKCNATGNTGEVWLGDHNRGLWAKGSDFGGIFQDTNGTGQTTLAIGNTGLTATGSLEGVNVSGGSWAGYFTDSNDGSEAYLAYGPQGIQARGATYGGEFIDTDSGSQAKVGFASYKIQGVGAVSFIQNHPDDPDRVIVYHAPESSEVSVYARGSGRLAGGTARLALDPTFAWVANPELGLTAHLTPHGASCALYVAEVSTSELAVGSDGPGCATVEFDYMVWGLRIGFEDLPPVQPKQEEARIPSMEEHRALYRSEPALHHFAAAARFEEAAVKQHGAAPDRSHGRAAEMLARIGEYNPALHGPIGVDRASERPVHLQRPSDANVDPAPTGAASPAAPGAAPNRAAATEPIPVIEVRPRQDDSPGSTGAEPLRFPVSDDVAPGDVLALDPDRPGYLHRAASIADPGVVGVAATEPGPGALSDSKEVAVLGTGFARVNADAGYGAIRPGDLLVSSPTAGHAMRAIAAEPGTVLGKAMHGLDTGTGQVLILLLAR